MNNKLEYINTKVEIGRLKSVLLTLHSRAQKLKKAEQRNNTDGVGHIMVNHIEILMRSNLTNTQIAKGAKVSIAAISQIRKGHRKIANLTIETGRKLDDYYYYLEDVDKA